LNNRKRDIRLGNYVVSGEKTLSRLVNISSIYREAIAETWSEERVVSRMMEKLVYDPKKDLLGQEFLSSPQSARNSSAFFGRHARSKEIIFLFLLGVLAFSEIPV
jgi:hypothetical protein